MPDCISESPSTTDCQLIGQLFLARFQDTAIWLCSSKIPGTLRHLQPHDVRFRYCILCFARHLYHGHSQYDIS